MNIGSLAAYLMLVGLIQALLVLLDKLLAPHQRAVVNSFFEDYWYQGIDNVPMRRYRKIALTVGQALSGLTTKRSWKRYLLLSIGVSVVFYALSQLLQMLFFHFEPVSEFEGIIPKLFLSFWFWSFPFALIINVVFFYCSIWVTARLLTFIGNGDWLDALFIPLIDLTIAAFLLIVSIYLIHNIPLLYGVEFYKLVFSDYKSIFDHYYGLVWIAEVMSGSLGAGLYGSAYSVFLPTLLFYLCYSLFLLVSFIQLIANKLFSQVALISSYEKFGGKPFTVFGYFVSAILIIGKVVVYILD